MTTIEIKEEGGCELYAVYINGKRVLGCLSELTTIEVNSFPDGTPDISVDGESI